MVASEDIGAAIRRGAREAVQRGAERLNAYLYQGAPEDVLWSNRTWRQWQNGTYDPNGPPEGLEAAMDDGGEYYGGS